MPLQLDHQLTEKQIADLQSENSYLRGTTALAVLNEAVKETGVVIPADYVFRERPRELVEKAIHAGFELIGGVPAFILWAQRNPTDFYKIYAKLAPTEAKVSGVGNIQVVTNMPNSSLNDKVMDSRGMVTAIVRDVPIDEEDDD